MNICVYWEQASWGGVDSYLKTLLSHWPDKHHNILLISNFGNKGLERIQTDIECLSSVKIKKITIFSQAQFVGKFDSPCFVLRLIGYALFPFFLLQNFVSIFLNLPLKTDLLISQNGAYPGGWSCIIVLFVAKIKRIKRRALVIHHSSTYRRIGWYGLEYLLDHMVVLLTDKVIAVSKASLDSFTHHRMVTLKPGQGVVIYNGVEKASTFEDGVVFHSENGRIKIGLVGRCEKRKGNFDILNALALLDSSTLSKIQLFFVGHCDQEFKNEVDKFCKQHGIISNVTISGYVPYSSHQIISNLDLLCCLTQDYEGFGLTVVEAMAAGVPVLTTDVGALKEFAIDGVNCFIVPPSSPQKIALKLIDFLENREKWLNLIPQAKKTADFFSAENMVNQYYQLLAGD